MTLKIAWGNVRRSVRDFAIYFITVALGVAVFYAFNSMGAQQGVLAFSQTQSEIMGLLSRVIGLVSGLIAVVMAYLVVYANRFLIRRRKKEFGTYLLLGMETAGVVRIVLAESAIVGAASLAVGLALGIGFSQLLLAATSALFKADIAAKANFAFVFSPDAFVATIVLFAAIFVLAAIVNSRTVARAKLIDFMQAESRVETMKLRSLPLSIVLFAVSIALIAAAYSLLLRNGLLAMGPEFIASCVLVVTGTALFFYSLSGFLLRAVKAIRPLYLRGLNAFTLRQLNARVNTAFATLTVVCLVLFLAITSVCGGMGLRNATEDSLAKGTSYSFTASTTFGMTGLGGEYHAVEYSAGQLDFAQSVGYDMCEGLAQSAQDAGLGDFRSLVTKSAQVDSLYLPSNPVTYGSIEQAAGFSLADLADNALISNESYAAYSVSVMRLSQVNAALELAGKSPLELGPGECAVVSDVDMLAPFWERLAAERTSLAIGQTPLRVSQYREVSLMTTPYQYNMGAVVVPDEAIPADAIIVETTLDVQSDSDIDGEAMASIVEKIGERNDLATWPPAAALSRSICYEQSVGISAMVSFLAIYMGFVLVIACAAILAIQQLSDASDNARRYGLLRKLGAPEGMISRALFIQVLVYFLFPLGLAAAHSACALAVVADVVQMFGRFDIGQTALLVSGAFVAVYGVYFALTYLGARRLARG